MCLSLCIVSPLASTNLADVRFLDAGLDIVCKVEGLCERMSVRFTCTKLIISLPLFEPRLLEFMKRASGVVE